MRFGRSARPLWSLDPSGIFLNHGSFGAAPRVVQEEQGRFRLQMEEQPDQFFDRIGPTGERPAIRAVADELGSYVGVSGERIALVENATVGTQAVLQSVELSHGDEILITDHQYPAVREAVDVRCRESGATARVVNIPLPTTAPAVRAAIRAAAHPRVKLAIVDHITSPTALVFPIREIVTDLHEAGIPVFVDGAHAVGQIPVSIPEIEPDWYVCNLHKWGYAARGSALLYADPAVAGRTRPAIVSHCIDLGFPRSFDWVGTRDYSAWLSVPKALEFLAELHAQGLRTHNERIITLASERLAAIGAETVGPTEMCAAMRSFVFPHGAARQEDPKELRRVLWDEHRIQVWAGWYQGAFVLRVSAQAYVGDEDVLALADALCAR